MFCEKCGAPLEDGTKFCDKCGAKQEQVGADMSQFTATSGMMEQPAVPVYKNQQGEEKKSHKGLILGGSIAVVVLVAAIVVGFLYYKNMGKDGDPNTAEAAVTEDTATGEQATGGTSKITPKAVETPEIKDANGASADAGAGTQADAAGSAATEAPAATTAPVVTEAPAAATDTMPQQMGGTMTYYVTNCDEFITLRTSDSTSAAEITKIPLGEAVVYEGTAGNGFYKVTYNGSTGYCLAQYLTENASEIHQGAGTSAETSGDYGTYVTYYVVNCKESITLRSSDNTSASEICQIPLGAAVSYVGTAGNGFYKIIYNGHTGYGLAAYLQKG